MKETLSINFSIDDINTFKKRNEAFSALSATEKYEFIKDTILKSDTVVFYIMTGCFLDDILEFPCMETLKKESEKYKDIIVNYPELGYTEPDEPFSETFCYRLDISTNDKKKLFFDNYCLYGNDEFSISLPELDTAFKVADNSFYAPYIFYFLSDTEIKLYIAHHTREMIIA